MATIMIFTTLFEPEQCKHLADPSITQFVWSCCLMAWLFICWVPQWARIAIRQSAEGLSTLYILIGSISGVCAVGNIMMLPSSAVDMGCCRTNSRFACLASLLGMIQVIFGIVCFWIILLMYVYYAEEEADAEIKGRRPSISGADRTFRRARRAWIVLLVTCAFAFAVLLVCAVVLHRFPRVAQTWADVLGIAVTVLAAIQWVPQVYTTWHLGHLGSLSLVGLILQVPYTWLFAVNMMVRVGWTGWSAWIVYVLVGLMKLVLIGFGVVFAYRDRGKRLEDKDRRPSISPSEVHDRFSIWKSFSQRGRTPSTNSRATQFSNVAPDEHHRAPSNTSRVHRYSNATNDERRPLFSEIRSPGERPLEH